MCFAIYKRPCLIVSIQCHCGEKLLQFSKTSRLARFSSAHTASENSFSALHKKRIYFFLRFSFALLVFYFNPKRILQTYGWVVFNQSRYLFACILIKIKLVDAFYSKRNKAMTILSHNMVLQRVHKKCRRDDWRIENVCEIKDEIYDVICNCSQWRDLSPF